MKIEGFCAIEAKLFFIFVVALSIPAFTKNSPLD
jgi:hypothetical protein